LGVVKGKHKKRQAHFLARLVIFPKTAQQMMRVLTNADQISAVWAGGRPQTNKNALQMPYWRKMAERRKKKDSRHFDVSPYVVSAGDRT
jgi:hypothetical protein